MTNVIEQLESRIAELKKMYSESVASDPKRKNSTARMDRALWMAEVRGLEYAIELLRREVA